MKQSREVEEEAKKYEKAPSSAKNDLPLCQVCQPLPFLRTQLHVAVLCLMSTGRGGKSESQFSTSCLRGSNQHIGILRLPRIHLNETLHNKEASLLIR